MRELIEYLETLTVPSGDRAGQKLKVFPWQKRFIHGAFKTTGDVSFSIARGAGKTALVAGIATAAIDPLGPLHFGRADVVAVASSFAQGRIIYDDVLSYLSTSYDLADRTTWRRQDSQNVASIEYLPTGTRVRCVGSDPRRMHGLRPAMVLCDEPAQWEHTKSEAALAALRTSLGKVPGSRLFALGTRPDSAHHWFGKMLADPETGYSQVHAANENDPPFQKRTWIKANPSLKYFPSLLARTKQEAGEARRDSTMLASFCALRLNLGTSDTVNNVLLDAGTWEAIEGDVPRQGMPVWGIDLGGSAAMSAVTAYWPVSGRLESFAMFPAVPDLRERGLKDGCGRLYLDCFERGELAVSGCRAVAIKMLIHEAASRFGQPIAVTADRWRQGELSDALNAAGIRSNASWRGMGFRDGAEDVRLFRRACLEGKVKPVVSLLMRSAMSESRVVADPAGNEKLSKQSQGGRRSTARDDAAAAAILGVSEGVRRSGQPCRVRYHGAV